MVSSLKCFIQCQKYLKLVNASKLTQRRTFTWNKGQIDAPIPNNFKYIKYILFGVVTTFGFSLAKYFELSRPKMPILKASFPGPHLLREKFNFTADVVEVISPAVVYVEIRDVRKLNQTTGQPLAVSAGSGFIVKSDGLIATNAHVVLQKLSQQSLYKVIVKLNDGRVFDAEVESIDKEFDLATLRIPVKNLPVIKLGRSNGLKPGEFVLAVGSPLALTNTATVGIVSAYRKPEEIGMKKCKTIYIQTDAAINNGNSGGPLMNLEGEAIGINSMNIIHGISFATPIDLVTFFLKESEDEARRMQIRKEVENMRYLGIVMLTLTSSVLEELKRTELVISSKVKTGVLLHRVIAGSPAEGGGLNPGDIVTHVNGKEVKNSSDIYDALLEKGKKLDMTVYRGLKQLRIVVEPEE